MHPLLLEAVTLSLDLHPDRKDEGVLCSVTGLIAPIQQEVLKIRYSPKPDPTKMLRPFMGTAIHALVEKLLKKSDLAGRESLLLENRFVGTFAGQKISGSLDALYLEDGKWVVADFKTTSAVTIIYDSRAKEWEEQVNIYAELAHLNGYEVSRVEIVPILYDHSDAARKKDKSGKYPKEPSLTRVMPLWTQDQRQAFIEDRVTRLVEALKLPDKDLPECKETWGGRRCASYCDCSPFCHQCKKTKASLEDF